MTVFRRALHHRHGGRRYQYRGAETGATTLADSGSVKTRMAGVIRAPLEHAAYEEIMCELAFERIVNRGLEDSLANRVKMQHRTPACMV